LTASRQNSTNRWCESLSPGPAWLLRLFCFPYAGGNALVFREWQKYLVPEIDVCLVHLPGRARRINERPHTQIQPLIQELADAIHTEVQGGRFAFWGHSMGALISFELAREFRRRNYPAPVHLFLSACRAPTVMKAVPPSFHLPAQEFIAEIQKLNGTPKEFFENPEIQKVLLPLLRSDFQITDTYQYHDENPLACPITVYGADQDNLATLNHLAPWKMQTSAAYKMRVFPGDHFFFQSQKKEFISTLRRDLIETLDV
jgi:surfactin synthase thioesterase subunit